MSKAMELPDGVDPLPFINEITEHLGNNLNGNVSKSISNLLAIDYANRLNSEPDITEYVELCVSRLKKHIGKEVVIEDGFSISMTLFTVAITPERDVSDDNDKGQEQSQDALIESIIGSHFGDLSPEEQANIKTVLKDLLTGKNGKEMMEIVVSDPKLFYSIVVSAIKSQKHQKQVMEFIEDHLTKVMNQSNKVQSKTGGLKNTIGKLALAGSVLLAASVGIVIGGLALPAIIVPAAIAAIKYGPIIGEKLGAGAVNQSSAIQKEVSALDNIKSASMATAQTLSKAQNQKIEKPKAITKTLSKAKIKSIVKSVDISSKEKSAVSKLNDSPQKTTSRSR